MYCIEGDGAEAEEEGDAVLDEDLPGQLLTLLPSGLHVVGEHLLREVQPIQDMAPPTLRVHWGQ